MSNRFDVRIRKQLTKHDVVTYDSFSDVVDKYFAGDAWEKQLPPRQIYPEALQEIFAALDRYRPAGWLVIDDFIRDLDEAGRNDLAKFISEIKQTLALFPSRRIHYGVEDPLQIWFCRAGSEPSRSTIQYQGQAGSLVSNGAVVRVLILSLDSNLHIVRAQCVTVERPSVFQANYPELHREAENQRSRLIWLRKKHRKKRKKR